MPIQDYDNTLIGRYIRQIENPDSIGFDKKNMTWMNPNLDPRVKSKSGFDKNQRGFGVDIKENKDARPIASKNKGKRLTEQQERDLRNKSIHYADSLIDAHSKAIPATRNMPEKMRMLATGFLYRGNDGKHGYNIWNEDNPVGRAYATGNEKAFENALYDYYNKMDLVDRAQKSQQFLEKNKQEIQQEQNRKKEWGKGKYIKRPVENQLVMKSNVIDNITERVEAAEKWADSWKERANIKAEGGSLDREKRAVGSEQLLRWEDLPMGDKAAYIRTAVDNGVTTLPEIRKAYKEFAEGGDLTDEEYIKIMEKVAHDNWQRWGDESEDAALLRILNDNSYNYRAYYNKYPNSRVNASTHWPDEFKTYYHPTFSNESIYSGKKSQYNPTGAIGGYWIGERYTPADIAHIVQSYPIREYAEGGILEKLQETNKSNMSYGTNVNIARIPRIYEDGGDTHQQQILKRAENKVRNKDIYNNYRDAVDVTLGTYASAPWIEWVSSQKPIQMPIVNKSVSIPAGGSNCTLNATQWVDPNMPLMSAKSITTNPQKYGYAEVLENETLPGDLVIADDKKGDDDDENIAYHTMLLQGYNQTEGKEYVLNGTPYHIHKDAPLVTYSNGRNESNSLRRSVPLESYIDQSEGKNNVRYYRNIERGVINGLIPTLTVTPNGNYYEDIQDIRHYWKGKR